MSIADENMLRAPARTILNRGQDGAFIRIYKYAFIVVFFTTFLTTWKYAISHYGLAVGGWLGWIPAVVLGMIFAGMWPVGVVLGGAAFIFMRLLNLT